jgi:rubrerythrin
MMQKEAAPAAKAETGDYVHFWAGGERAKGEFHCAECGYGVTVHDVLPVCPVCSSRSWERSAWSPFARAGA